MQLWHYTVLPHYKSIEKDGYIRPASEYIGEGEKPVVWLSSNSSFENTARKSLIDKQTGKRIDYLSRDELFAHGVIPVRLLVDTSRVQVYPWRENYARCDMSQELARQLEDAGRKMGADPNDWWFSAEAVPLAACTQLDVWNGVAWESCPVAYGNE